MLTRDGRVKIMDFGLAKLKESSRLTRTSSAVGTLGYMAPEQIQGGEVDARCDIFSLGVVLFEILTGRLPFRGEHEPAIMYSILHEEPLSLVALRPEVSLSLVKIVDRLLQKSPDQRYQQTREVVEDLRNLATVAGQPREPGGVSIAVLAFEDMSPQKDHDYLCEGLAEEIINALTKIKALRVSARTSAFAFKGKHQDVREIGRKLNVQTVLEGSVRKSGNRLRISTQLIDVENGYHLWSERYDREMKDVFEIQDEITENVVRALKVVLTERDKYSLGSSVVTPEIEAYEYYLRGRKLFHQHRTREEASIQMFLRATQIDPRYALAYCGLADCYSFRYMYWESSDANLHQAEEASTKAIELNPHLAEAHTSLGLASSLRKRYELADQEFERAISLNPRLFEAHYYYGRTCFVRGEFERAARLYEEAVRVRPEDYQVSSLLSSVYRSLNDVTKYSEAIRSAVQKIERHLEFNPDDARAYYMGGGALIQMGQGERGERWVEKALALDPNNPGTLYNVACAFVQMGKHDRAMECLEQAIGLGFAHREWIEHDSDLDPIRTSPRFQQLLAGMKC
jgi:TolB-like protein/Flp pilus assembly protein TadD